MAYTGNNPTEVPLSEKDFREGSVTSDRLGNIMDFTDKTFSVSDINGGQLAGFRNWIINGNFTINQRAASTKAQANGTYGYDRWKGVANIGANTDTLEQVVEGLPAGEYTLSWSGGGDGSLAGGAAAASPITATVTVGNTSVKVPATATEVQLERGPVATPFEHRPVGVELALCKRYFESTEAFARYDAPLPSDLTMGSFVYFSVTKRVAPTVTIAFTAYTNTNNADTKISYEEGLNWTYLALSAGGGVVARSIAVVFESDAEL